MTPFEQAQDELRSAEQLVAEKRWHEAAAAFYRAADAFHSSGEHDSESEALRRAAQTYEATQSWRSAGDSWLRTARARSGHPTEPEDTPRRDPAGEAYMWAGYTFFWADQHYDSWRAHTLGGLAFERAADWQTAERCYMYAAISKAHAFASLGVPNRFVHSRYSEVSETDLLDALRRVNTHRREADPENKSAADRSHIDALFMTRRALEQSGNENQARHVYVLEQNARLRLAIDGRKMIESIGRGFYKWVLGYGEGLPNLAVVSAVIFGGIFPLSYALLPDLEGAHRPSDYLLFSLASLTTLDAGGLHPTQAIAWLTHVEFLVGVVVFGLLVSVVVRLMQR